MNYFAHGYAYVDDPWFLVGTAVPDLLNVSDRGVRVRSKHAEALAADSDSRVASLARGIMQHHADDAWFHNTAAFAELSWRFTAELRDFLGPDEGLRPSFLGHILVELLLDAALIAADPPALERYYAAFASVDAGLLEQTVNRIAPRPAVRLSSFFPLFVRERFLYDYSEDGKLCYRLNQVMRRVRLPLLPPRLQEYLPTARRAVADLRQALLAPQQETEARE